MLRYSRAVCRERLGDDGPLPIAPPTPVLEAIIACVQSELREREMFETVAAVELFSAQAWALYALREREGNRVAKETQIRLANGRPLAICIGGGITKDVPLYLDGFKEPHVFKVAGRGCYRVFDDVTRTSGKMWPQLCPDCRNRNGKRKPLRDAERALKRRVAQMEALRRSSG